MAGKIIVSLGLIIPNGESLHISKFIFLLLSLVVFENPCVWHHPPGKFCHHLKNKALFRWLDHPCGHDLHLSLHGFSLLKWDKDILDEICASVKKMFFEITASNRNVYTHLTI